MFPEKQFTLWLALSALVCAGTVASFGKGGTAGMFDKLANSDTNIEFDEARIATDGKRQHLSGNVVVAVGDLEIRTQELIYDVDTRYASLPGTVEVNFASMRFLTSGAEFDGEKQTLKANDVRGCADLAFISGTGIEASQQKFFVKDGVFYFCEPHWSSIAFHTDELEYNAETDRLRLDGSVFRIAGVPVMAFPPLSVPRIERPPVRVWANTGSGGASGIYLRTTTHLTLWETFEPGVLLDFYERSGLLAGPAGAYQLGDFSGERWAKGEIQTAYINDTANRENDIYGNAIGGPRGFVEWRHKQEIDGLEISASMHYWSDSETMRNFRPDVFDANQNPDSYIEFVLPDDAYYLSAMTRFRLNEYQNVQQRLPEIRFDLQPREILETGVFQRFNASYAWLQEIDSDQYRLRQINSRDDRLESSRADFYYGLNAPVKLGDIATFTPVLGARVTYYGETVPEEQDAYTRTLGQIGFDFQLLASGAFGYKNETWGIDGLRHVLRPVVQYRYIPGTASQSSRIPEIDREVYLAGPSVIDLAENRAVDQIYDEQALRIGLENLFQTRDNEYGSRDLAELNIYQDLRKTYRPNDTRTLSHNFIELEVKPASWVTCFARHRMDVYNFETKAFTGGVRFADGDLWMLNFAYSYVDDENRAYYGYEPNVRQFEINGSYKLNSYFSVFGAWHFNDLTNTLTEQYYGLHQRLGNSWLVQYYVKYRKDARDDDDFSIGLSLNLVTF